MLCAEPSSAQLTHTHAQRDTVTQNIIAALTSGTIAMKDRP